MGLKQAFLPCWCQAEWCFAHWGSSSHPLPLVLDLQPLTGKLLEEGPPALRPHLNPWYANAHLFCLSKGAGFCWWKYVLDPRMFLKVNVGQSKKQKLESWLLPSIYQVVQMQKQLLQIGEKKSNQNTSQLNLILQPLISVLKQVTARILPHCVTLTWEAMGLGRYCFLE